MIAGTYGSDYRGYMGQAGALDYINGSQVNNGQPLPGSFIEMGMTNPLTRLADHYVAMKYLPATTNAQGKPGHEMLICPRVRRQFPDLASTYWQGTGNVETHYFFSTLIYRPTVLSGYRRIRNNVWGPYRLMQLKNPSQTFLAGDGIVITDDVEAGGKRAMLDRFNLENIGEISVMFGVIASHHRSWKDNNTLYHKGGPNGLYFDGHVAQVPPREDRYYLRRNFSADLTDERHTNTAP